MGALVTLNTIFLRKFASKARATARSSNSRNDSSGALNRTLDIWSVFCLVFELITGRLLVCVPGCEFEEEDHLLFLTAHLSPIPDEIFRDWKTSSWYITPEIKLFNSELGGVREGEEPLIVERLSMEELFDQVGPELGEEEARTVKALIRRILQYNPAKRPNPGGTSA